MTPAGTDNWWHAYGAVLPDDDEEYPGCWALAVAGPTDLGPDFAASTVPGKLPYLTSWDHEPTDEEKDALEPVDFDDDEEEPEMVTGPGLGST